MINRSTLFEYPQDIEIRGLSLIDRASLFKFRCAFPGEKYSEAVENIIASGELYKTWNSTRKSEEAVEVFLAESTIGMEKEIVGLIAFVCFWAGHDFSFSKILAVVPHRRREKIGSALKQAAINSTARRGSTGMFSYVDPENIPMLRVNDQWEPETDYENEEKEALKDAFLKTVIAYQA